MTVVVRAASRALAPFVATLGYFETDSLHGREVVLPTGTMALVVNLAEDHVRVFDGDGYATAHTRRGAVLLGARAGRIAVSRCAA